MQFAKAIETFIGGEASLQHFNRTPSVATRPILRKLWPHLHAQGRKQAVRKRSGRLSFF